MIHDYISHVDGTLTSAEVPIDPKLLQRVFKFFVIHIEYF